jgi:hypothetical protein
MKAPFMPKLILLQRIHLVSCLVICEQVDLQFKKLPAFLGLVCGAATFRPRIVTYRKRCKADDGRMDRVWWPRIIWNYILVE